MTSKAFLLRLAILKHGRAAVAALLLAAAPAAADPPRQAPASPGDVLLSYAPVVKKAQPAVVNVYASRVEKRPKNPLLDDPFFERFFGGGGHPGGSTARSLGSGVLVDSSGLVVTNVHVIEGMTDVKVALSDKREFDADIVLRDERTDLAVLRLKGGGGPFPVVELGDSDAIEVGDIVLAIGDPFGVGQTVTHGIVSAVARTQAGISDSGFFIQTDAAINPGNSGGGLIDMKGRLIGINSAIFSQTGNSVGIGFAIPVNMVKIVIAAAKTGQRVRRPWFGASLQTVSREIADSLGLARPSGALVAEVIADGPAAKAGVKQGDLVTAVDGQSVDDPESFGYRLATKPLGGAATLALLRNGTPVNVTLSLTPAAEVPPRDPVKLTGDSPFAGATVVNLSPAVIEDMSLHGASEGVVISEIEDGSTAAAVNFQKGDLILAVNDAKVKTTRDLERAASGRHNYWKLTISRGGEVVTTMIGG
jgi:Do/DeqQ family serine protease